MGHGYGSKNNLLHLKPFVSLVRFLLSHRFEIMENSKRSAEEALNGAASSRQRLCHQEGATCDAPTTSGHRADSVQPSGFSSSTARRQLPCYSRSRINNDNLLASIDRAGQNLTDCLSPAESALAMVRCRSPPKADLVEDRLAEAEARITSEMPTTTFCLLLILSSRS